MKLVLLLLLAVCGLSVSSKDCAGKVCKSRECKKVVKYFAAHVEIVGPDFECNSPIDFSNDSQLLISEQDPFLVLHEFGPRDWAVGENKGVPLHPHAGFESVTYIKTGESKHTDNLGNGKILYSGDCQWTSAGNGILHSESTQHPGGLQHGFQFWINVKREYKYNSPKYQFLSHKTFPYLSVDDNVKMKVIVGKYYDDMNDKWHESPISTNANAYILDIMIGSGGSYLYEIPSDYSFETYIIYVYQGIGSIKNGDEWIDVSRKSTIYFDGVNGNCIQAKSMRAAIQFGFVLMIGEPVKEDIFGDNTDLHKGFIMNTQKEVDDFVEKFENGDFVQQLEPPQKIIF